VALVGDCALAVAGTASAQTPRTIKSTRYLACRVMLVLVRTLIVLLLCVQRVFSCREGCALGVSVPFQTSNSW
jgi:hypothetical protein